MAGLAQDLYTQAYGDATVPAILYLHGGPGYHSVMFEVGTAQVLADAGFYVVVYDRRGEGRSGHLAASYTFEESIADLEGILDAYDLSTITLMGHGFGGVLATQYAERYPDRVQSLVLVTTSLCVQFLMRTILQKSREIYEDQNDTFSLRELDLLERLDSTSLGYVQYLTEDAKRHGLYRAQRTSDEAERLYDTAFVSPQMQAARSAPVEIAQQRFYEQERLSTLDITDQLQQLQQRGITLYAMYGEGDQLHDTAHRRRIKSLVGSEHFFLLPQAAQFIFLDQQTEFVATLRRFLLQ